MNEFGNITVHEAESNFKKVHRSIILNVNIDCVTLGVYVRIMTLGKSWRLNISGLSTQLKLSDAKIRSAIKSLEKEGYIKRVPVRMPDGKFKGWNYDIYDQPINEYERSNVSETNNRHIEKPYVGENRPMDLPQYGEHRNTVNSYDNNNRLNLTNRLNNNNRLDKREDNASFDASHSPQQQFEIIPIIKEKEDSDMLGSTAVVISEKVARARKKSLEEREHDFGNSLIPYLDEYGKDTIRDFFNYWSEPNQAKTKMKYELEKTWSVKRRLATWVKNEQKFSNNGFKTKKQEFNEDLARFAEKCERDSYNAQFITRAEELKRLEDIPF